jgi:glycosyltransferase involved in cell wall biosynthesis
VTGSTAPRVLVVTVAHRGDDARISERQIGALLRAGLQVSFAAPAPADETRPIERIELPRAVGRRRIRAWWAAARAVRRCRGSVDLVLVHDLEAVIPVRLARPGVPVVWDVHEDFVASVSDRAWIPGPLRPVARWTTRAVERIARTGIGLLLAEAAYARRLGGWPIVPNTTVVPAQPVPFDPGAPLRAVYVGRLSQARGVSTMIEAARHLQGRVEVVLIGPADEAAASDLRAAHDAGIVTWRGPLTNDAAMAVVDGALVGLCLLHPTPNYLVSMPTKVYEYYAHGVPAVVSRLPLAAAAVDESTAGVVVAEFDALAVAAAVLEYADDPRRRVAEGLAAHRWAAAHHDWTSDGCAFADHLRSLATRSS